METNRHHVRARQRTCREQRIPAHSAGSIPIGLDPSEHAYILLAVMNGNGKEASVLVIGGPNPREDLGKGIARIKCTPKAILACRIRSTVRCVVYWPTRECFKPLPRNTGMETIENSGVDYESFWRPLPLLDGPAGSGRSFPVMLKATVDGAAEMRELTYRATKSKLLEILLRLHEGLICICVVPDDFSTFPADALRAFRWISTKLDCRETGYHSGVRLAATVKERGCRLSRLIASLPIEAAANTRTMDIANMFGVQPWRAHVSEFYGELDLFDRWPGVDMKVDCQRAHINGQSEVLSLAFFAGKGGVAIIPPVLGIRDILELLGRVERVEEPAPQQQTAETQTTPPKLILTKDRRRPGLRGNAGFLVECNGKHAIMGRVSFIRLLAFVVAARVGSPDIDLAAPAIGGQSIKAQFDAVLEHFFKVAQNLRLALRVRDPSGAPVGVDLGSLLEELNAQSVIECVDDRTQSVYRLAIPCELVDVQGLRGSTDEDIRSLMNLLPVGR